MPKPVRELEERRRPLEERVLEFLVKNRENAYTLDEVVAGVESPGDENRQKLMLAILLLSKSRNADLWLRYENALKDLGARKRVRIFQEDAATYYAASDAS